MTIMIKLKYLDDMKTEKGQITLNVIKNPESLGFDYYVADHWHAYLSNKLLTNLQYKMVYKLARILKYKPVFVVYEFGKVKGDPNPYRNLYPQVYTSDGKLMTKHYGNLNDYTRRNG